MSSYVNFFIRTNDVFIPIASYSRSTRVYKIFEGMPYEKVAAISASRLKELSFEAQESTNYINRQIEKCHRRKEIIATFNNTVDEKYEMICDIEREAEDWQYEKRETEAAEDFIQFLRSMIDEIQYNEDKKVSEHIRDCDHYIYCGIEVSANLSEEDIVQED